MPLDRPHLPAGIRTEVADGGRSLHFLALAAEVQDPFLGCLWQDRGGICEGGLSVCGGSPHSPHPLQEGSEQRGDRSPYLEAAAQEGKDRVVLIGVAQEKASVWRSWPRKGQEKARHPHMDWGREMAFINHFYFCLWDVEWGGAFWKT